jgi:predicted polyphosphate/ATP-dependent NAD kinase
VATVGIIANPASGKDIRRLVAYGTVFDNQEKVNIVRRILLGLAAAGVERVLFMPDYYGIVPKAIDGLSSCHRLPMAVEAVDIMLTGTQEDSRQAALAMNACRADCIVTLGGDGTNRMVAKGCGNIPLMPVSTGTNNVFPVMVEGTTAGLAAGVVACGVANGPPAVRRTKQLVVYRDGCPLDIALIDAVVLEDCFIGSRAIWEGERLRQVVTTRGEPHNIGISSIGGNLIPVGAHEARGLCLEFGAKRVTVLAPVAPGLIIPVAVESFRAIAVGETVELATGQWIIALDGERELEVKAADKMAIKLTFDGPAVVDVRAALATAAARGRFRCEGQ